MYTIVCWILACPNRSRAFKSRGWAGSVTPGTFLRESASARLQALRSDVPPAHVAAVPRALHLSRALTPGLTGWRRAGDATRGVSVRDCRDSPRWWVPGSGPGASPTASPAGGTPHGDTPWGDLPCPPGQGAGARPGVCA